MAVERSTKQQVQAYRFGVRRIEHALATGESTRPQLLGPRPGVSLLVGLVIAGLLLAAFAVYGLLKPAPAIGDAAVVVDADSGSAFVIREGVAHPAMNLASAMLAAAGEAGSPGGAPAAAPTVRTVTSETLASVPKGQLLGIPGAPGQVPSDSALVGNVWQVCDLLGVDRAAAPGTAATLRTTVIVGGPGAAPAPRKHALLVSADGGETTWLVMGGERSRVDFQDTALAAGLGLLRDDVRRISLGLLNAIPEGKPIERVVIPGEGGPVSYGSARFTVGEVVRVERATGGVGFYLALEDGPQLVTPVVADVIRSVTGQGDTVRTVPPTAVSGAPAPRVPLDIEAFPEERPVVVGVAQAPGVCLDWRVADGVPVVRVDPVLALPLPAGARPVPAPPSSAGAALPGTGVADEVFMPPGGGLAVGQSQFEGSAALGSLFLVTDQGIAYPVVDRAAMTALGLQTVTPAPPELVSLLPLGPTLDPVAARRFFDATLGSRPS